SHSGFALRTSTCTSAPKERRGSIGRKPAHIRRSTLRILRSFVNPSRRPELRLGKGTQPGETFPIPVDFFVKIRGEIPWNLWNSLRKVKQLENQQAIMSTHPDLEFEHFGSLMYRKNKNPFQRWPIAARYRNVPIDAR